MDLRFDGGRMLIDHRVNLGFVLCSIQRRNQFASLGFFGLGIGLDRQPGGQGPSLYFQILEVLAR
ncbi:hypothetical protein D3C84_1026680 [compost metagenome]